MLTVLLEGGNYFLLCDILEVLQLKDLFKHQPFWNCCMGEKSNSTSLQGQLFSYSSSELFCSLAC